MIKPKRLEGEEAAAQVLISKDFGPDASNHAKSLGLEAITRMVEADRPGWTIDEATVKVKIVPISPMLKDEAMQGALVHELDMWLVTATTRPKLTPTE